MTSLQEFRCELCGRITRRAEGVAVQTVQVPTLSLRLSAFLQGVAERIAAL
jgi:hypothetical protein